MIDNKKIQSLDIVSSNTESSMNDSSSHFYTGLYCLYRNDLTRAKNYLLQASNVLDSMDDLYWKCFSYLGLVEILINKSNGGLHRCYQASNEQKGDAELYLNIAYAEYLLDNRSRCVTALNKCLEMEPDNVMAQSFYKCIGMRTRMNPIKKVLGKLLGKKRKKSCNDRLLNIMKNHLAFVLNYHVNKCVRPGW